jgi:hypothetical protein
MKKAIYILLVSVMCTACMQLDQKQDFDAADIQLSTNSPLRICTFSNGQYQTLVGLGTLKQMFLPLAASSIEDIQFLQIDGTHYMEAKHPNGRRYIELITNSMDNSLLLGTRMTTCESGGVCKSCKYTGGSSCGCANGTDDCKYDAMTVIW